VYDGRGRRVAIPGVANRCEFDPVGATPRRSLPVLPAADRDAPAGV